MGESFLTTEPFNQDSRVVRTLLYMMRVQAFTNTTLSASMKLKLREKLSQAQRYSIKDLRW